MQVLIADDDPIARRRMEVLLQIWGFEVVVALRAARSIATKYPAQA